MMDGMQALLAGMERLGIPWMLGGSVGAMCYSEPRATLDIDCILDCQARQVGRIIAAFPEDDFYLPPENVLQHELRRGAQGSFNIIHQVSGFKADCYPAGDDDLMRWGLAHVQRLPVADMVVPVAPPEYIAAMKLRFFAMSGQEKHLRDIRSMVRLLPSLDHRLVQEWSVRYGVSDAWRLAGGLTQ